MRCASCKNHVIQKSGQQTKIRIKGPVVIGDDGTCKASCHWCGTPVVVPLSIDSGTKIQTEKFVLSNRG